MELELHIREILESPSDLSDKVRALTQEAQSAPDEESFFIYLRFLFNAGFFQEFLSLVAESLERRAQIPWGLLIELLGQNQVNLSPSVVESLRKGIKRQNAETMIWAAYSLDSLFPEFASMREGLAKKFSQAEERRKEELLEKFEFLKNQRLEKEALQVLRLLKSTYPHDSQIKSLSSGFEEVRAREVLDDFLHASEKTRTQAFRFSKDELNFLELLRQSALTHIQRKPQDTWDLCLFFLFLDDYESALEIMNSQKSLTWAQAWLRAELLKQARRFIEALQQIDKIATQFSDQSDALIAITYFRAEIYGAMEQYPRAIELLESIARIRPQYRSTTRLLQDFKSQGSNL